MKKSYVKPMLYAETFELVEHIAGCGTIVKYDGGKMIETNSGLTLFGTADVCGDMAMATWTLAGIEPSEPNLGQLAATAACYTTFSMFAPGVIQTS